MPTGNIQRRSFYLRFLSGCNVVRFPLVSMIVRHDNDNFAALTMSSAIEAGVSTMYVQNFMCVLAGRFSPPIKQLRGPWRRSASVSYAST